MLSPHSLKRLLPVLALPAGLLVSPAYGQVSGVTSIDVTQNNIDYFHLAEVQAFTGGVGGTNQALSGTATATSSGFGTTPQDAIDGDTSGQYANPGPIWHDGEAANTTADTWSVVFANPVTIDTVRLFGRTDCCQARDNNITLTLRGTSGVLFTTQTGIPDATQQITIAVPEPALGLAGVAVAGLSLRRRRR